MVPSKGGAKTTFANAGQSWNKEVNNFSIVHGNI